MNIDNELLGAIREILSAQRCIKTKKKNFFNVSMIK